VGFASITPSLQRPAAPAETAMPIERPKLRNLEPIPTQVEGRQMIALRDPYHFAEQTVLVPEEVFFILTLFDGQHTVLDIQAEYMRRFGDLLFSDRVRQIIEQMDEACLLESERFESRKKRVEVEFRAARIRKSSHAGAAYEDDPAKLSAQLDGFFAPPDGPGKPSPQVGAKPVKGLVAPHIDLLRGGPCYAWAYHALGQACNAEVFVILGTVHIPTRQLFTATRKTFETPLGLMHTDRRFVDALARSYGERLFEDEFAHKIEHTIEFQVVFLQHLLGPSAIRTPIVPILCSSFLEQAKGKGGPLALPEVKGFVAALKDTITSSGKRVCLIASADLAHVGPRFGDQQRLSPGVLSLVESEDREMLKHVERVDADAFFQAVAKEDDPRRICGLPPMYVLLSAIAATEGKLLRYAQAADLDGLSCVTFAATSFV